MYYKYIHSIQPLIENQVQLLSKQYPTEAIDHLNEFNIYKSNSVGSNGNEFTKPLINGPIQSLASDSVAEVREPLAEQISPIHALCQYQYPIDLKHHLVKVVRVTLLLYIIQNQLK